MKYMWVFLALFPAIALAYDREQAKLKLASDYATCAAFHTLMSSSDESLKNNPKVYAVGKLAYDTAVEYSNHKIAQALMEMDGIQMMKEMDNKWSNAMIIINKYGPFCKELMENPESRIKYWLEKKD